MKRSSLVNLGQVGEPTYQTGSTLTTHTIGSSFFFIILCFHVPCSHLFRVNDASCCDK